MPLPPLCDLDAAMRAVEDRVRADAAGVGPPVALRITPDGRVVVAIGEGREAGIGFDDGLEPAVGRAMDVLQDEICDALWRPWPEVDDGVLDVAVGASGLAHWTLRGEPVCPVGLLAATCRALGWHVR